MSIITPIITSIIKPIITNIVSIASSISRYFQYYNGTSSFGVFATPKVFTGDFTAFIDVAVSDNTKHHTLLGDDSNLAWIRINSTGAITVKGAGQSATSPNGVVTFDGEFHTIKLVRVDTAISLYYKDVFVVTYGKVFSGDMAFSRVGNYSSSDFLKGTLANLILTDDALSETLTFPLVESDIEYPLERDTTEHMTNGDFATDDLTGWTPSNATQSVVNNSLELVDAGGSAHTIHLLLVPHADTDYDISIDMRAAAGNTNPLAASVELGGTVYRVAAEDTIETITATVSSSNFGYIEIKCATWGGSNGDTAYFSNISVQKASNYLTFTDVTLIELP